MTRHPPEALEEKALPCPICGKRPSLVVGLVLSELRCEQFNGDNQHCVKAYGVSPEEALVSWNRRAALHPDPAQAGRTVVIPLLLPDQKEYLDQVFESDRRSREYDPSTIVGGPKHPPAQAGRLRAEGEIAEMTAMIQSASHYEGCVNGIGQPALKRWRDALALAARDRAALEAENQRLREVLEPFAAAAKWPIGLNVERGREVVQCDWVRVGYPPQKLGGFGIEANAFRRARAALQPQPQAATDEVGS